MKAEYTPLIDMDKVLEYYPVYFFDEDPIVRANILDDETGKEKWVFINDKGGIVGGRSWDWIDDFHGSYARVMKGDKVGMVNKRGNIKVHPVWDAIEPESCGYMVVKHKGKFGAVNTEGSVVIAPDWDELFSCTEQRFIAKKEGKYFILDTYKLNEPIEVQWECRHIEPFQHGVALFMDDEAPCRYGLIDGKGRLIEPPVWDTATRMYPDGTRYVRMDGKLQLVRMVQDDE